MRPDDEWRSGMDRSKRLGDRHCADRSSAAPLPVHAESVRQADEMTEDGTFPPVSVVIPTRDRPMLLARAVASVVGQDYPGDIECLVVFDQSEERLPETGGTRRSCAVRGMSNLRTSGLAGARNLRAF